MAKVIAWAPRNVLVKLRSGKTVKIPRWKWEVFGEAWVESLHAPPKEIKITSLSELWQASATG